MTTNQRGRSVTVRAMIVAHAAPMTSMRGIERARAMGGPHAKTGGASPGPYTRRTARKRFNTFERRRIATGVLLDPSARWMVVTWRRKKIEKLPPRITRK
jgi:hypothetical protein